MRLLLLIVLLFGTVGCVYTPKTTTTSLFSDNINQQLISLASSYAGLKEKEDRAELKKLMNVDPVRTEWCAAFVNAILKKVGVEQSGAVHSNPLLARSFLLWGQTISRHNIQPGDIVVFPRGTAGWQGHVGIFHSSTQRNGKTVWIILGGNQGERVSYMYFRPNYAIGIRRAVGYKKSNS